MNYLNILALLVSQRTEILEFIFDNRVEKILNPYLHSIRYTLIRQRPNEIVYHDMAIKGAAANLYSLSC